jgi:hypothetical protein
MNKKLIRLTEADLHRIVKESVNKVLTELDWKTYANYAKGRLNQGNREEYAKGREMVNKAFNDKYFDGEDVPYDMIEKGVHMKEPFGDDRTYVKQTWRDHNGGWQKGLTDDEARTLVSKDDKYGKFADSFIDAAHDYGDYYGGKSKYIKGKGWQ